MHLFNLDLWIVSLICWTPGLLVCCYWRCCVCGRVVWVARDRAVWRFDCCMHVNLSNYLITWFCHSVYFCIWMMYSSYLCVELNVLIGYMCQCSRFDLPIPDRNRHIPDRYVPFPIFRIIALVFPSAFPVPGKKIKEQEQLGSFPERSRLFSSLHNMSFLVWGVDVQRYFPYGW